MRILDRYIASHVVSGSLLALSVLVALFAFISFIDDLDSIGKGAYGIANALEYMGLTLPKLAFSLFPLAALIGSLMGLGVMSSHSELSVIRAAGISVSRVTFAVLKGAAVLVVLALIVGEVLSPYAERLAQQRRSLALSDQITLRTTYGFWIRDGNSFINIRKVLPGNRMGDLFIYEFDDDNRLRTATYAQHAVHTNGEWLLEGIRQSVILDDSVVSKEVGKAAWTALFEPDLVNVVAVKPETLSAVGLYRYVQYLHTNGLNADRFELALWSKVVYPIATGVMIFVAVPLVLGRLSNAGLGQRILVGALLGIAFHVFQQASGHMGLVYGLTPALSATVPTLAFFALGVWMMRRLT